ncbi:hypothetical protein [Streptomyces sp. SID9913]|uniref:sterol desaturase family protein n=1 Tax=Streptomyces sp. SID9913 TaxID=2706117 RepID=UPI001EF1DC95|nr:hypothetical protein [Streptomyces sp. SID9913]
MGLLALLAAVGASFLAERLLPYAPEWNVPMADRRRDAVHAAGNETLILASVAGLPVLAAIVTVADVWPSSWPFGLQMLLAVLVADAGITLVHYASHKVGLLWRFHAVTTP